MIKAACVNIEISHPLNFAVTMEKHKLDMSYHGVFSDGFRTDNEVKKFMDEAGVKKYYTSLRDMAGDVDIGFIHDCNWNKHLEHALPFIEAGKAVFIDKPVVGSMRDCLKLEELAGKGARIIGSSSIRYAVEIRDLKGKIADNGERIVTVFGTAGSDEFNYGIHIMEGIHGLLGAGAVSNRFLGISRNGKYPAEQYFVKWNSGVQVIYQLQSGVGQKFHMLVTTDKSIYSIVIDTGKIYLELLKRIQAYLKENVPMASVRELSETIKIFLAGKKSRENNGQEIALKNLSVDDAGYDGYAFERKYEIQHLAKR